MLCSTVVPIVECTMVMYMDIYTYIVFFSFGCDTQFTQKLLLYLMRIFGRFQSPSEITEGYCCSIHCHCAICYWHATEKLTVLNYNLNKIVYISEVNLCTIILDFQLFDPSNWFCLNSRAVCGYRLPGKNWSRIILNPSCLAALPGSNNVLEKKNSESQ